MTCTVCPKYHDRQPWRVTVTLHWCKRFGHASHLVRNEDEEKTLYYKPILTE